MVMERDYDPRFDEVYAALEIIEDRIHGIAQTYLTLVGMM